MVLNQQLKYNILDKIEKGVFIGLFLILSSLILFLYQRLQRIQKIRVKNLKHNNGDITMEKIYQN